MRYIYCNVKNTDQAEKQRRQDSSIIMKTKIITYVFLMVLWHFTERHHSSQLSRGEFWRASASILRTQFFDVFAEADADAPWRKANFLPQRSYFLATPKLQLHYFALLPVYFKHYHCCWQCGRFLANADADPKFQDLPYRYICYIHVHCFTINLLFHYYVYVHCLIRPSPKWSILCRAGRWTIRTLGLTQSKNVPLCNCPYLCQLLINF